MKAHKRLWIAGLLMLPAVALGTDFSAHWHDGRAELDGYRWTGARYGETRTGQAVMIYVTEPFSESRRVKVDDPSRNPSDTFDALKLNLVRDFQTGIYDYNTMVSVFVRSSDFSPVKTTFTSAEWCGHVYGEQRFDAEKIQDRYFSYFENESSERTLDWKKGGITEDNLYILLRGLRGHFLPPGGKQSFPFLPGVFHNRLTHGEAEWTSVEIERYAEGQIVDVPAGSFAVITYVLRTAWGREGRFDVEAEYPHRIVRWSWGSGAEAEGRKRLGGTESAELTGTSRVKYWELNRDGHESHLEALGLRPLPQ
jgi:hypothetical protein